MRLGAKLAETITKRLNDKDREAAAAMDCSIKVGVCAVFLTPVLKMTGGHPHRESAE